MNRRSIPIELRHPRPDPVRREQVDPGEHPHQVVDPEGEDQEQEHDPAPAAGVAGGEVGDRVADQEREPERDRDEDERAHEDCEELLAVPDVLERLEHVADVPVERIPERDRLRERVLVPEGDGYHRIEGEQEEDRQPEDAREREQPPGPARCHGSAGLELRPGLVPVLLAGHAQLQQLLVGGELLGPDDGAR